MKFRDYIDFNIKMYKTNGREPFYFLQILSGTEINFSMFGYINMQKRGLMFIQRGNGRYIR